MDAGLKQWIITGVSIAMCAIAFVPGAKVTKGLKAVGGIGIGELSIRSPENPFTEAP